MPPPPPPPPPEAPAPTLPDDLIEDIFLRLPTAEPASLVRASLANKHWFGLLTGARFRGRYCEFHGSPPMLGFFYSSVGDSRWKKEEPVPDFISTTNFAARIPDDKDWRDQVSRYSVRDCRHGRVLLCDTRLSPALFVVWDPKTGCQRELRLPFDFPSQRAAVLCAVSGCDHRACHDGPFQVVLVGLEGDGGCYVFHSVSSPKTGEWRKPCSCRHHGSDWKLWKPCSCRNHGSDWELWSENRYDRDFGDNAYMQSLAPVLVQDALHFMLSYEDEGTSMYGILKYDLGTRCLSLIDAPQPDIYFVRNVMLTAMEDSSLGFVRVLGLTLNLWTRQIGYEGVETWVTRIAINLKELLPIQNPENILRLVGSVEGTDVIFLTTNLGIYEINLKSLRWKKIWKTEDFLALFPYMSFYNPPERPTACEFV